MLKVQLLTSTAQAPRQMNPEDSGYDLFSDEDLTLEPFFQSMIVTEDEYRKFEWPEPVLVSTGVAIQLEPNFFLPSGTRADIQIRGRSGLAAKGILTHVGTIEVNYQRELKVALFNCSPRPFEIKRGDRIGQLILGLQLIPQVVTVVDELIPTRSGFGSTGA